METQQPEQRQQRLQRIVQQWEAQGRVDDQDVQWLLLSALSRQFSGDQGQGYQPQPEQPV